jgi:hypothetical protein
MYAMNPSFNAADPSAQVPPQLVSAARPPFTEFTTSRLTSQLPHVHLVSTYRFPTLQNLQPALALEYLVKGPSIVKDAAAVAWNYFASPPPDGTVLLTWQPPRLGTHFASDGLVWADAEIAYDMNIRGYVCQLTRNAPQQLMPCSKYKYSSTRAVTTTHTNRMQHMRAIAIDSPMDLAHSILTCGSCITPWRSRASGYPQVRFQYQGKLINSFQCVRSSKALAS